MSERLTRRDALRTLSIAGIGALAIPLISSPQPGPQGPPGPGGGSEDWKVKIDSADTTQDFLNAKLNVDANYLTETVQNPGANENLLLGFANPFTKTITIIPSTDVQALILKGKASGTSPIVEIYDSAASQAKKWKINKDGNLVLLSDATGRPKILLEDNAVTLSQKILSFDGNFLILGDATGGGTSWRADGARWDFIMSDVRADSLSDRNGNQWYQSVTTLRHELGSTSRELRFRSSGLITNQDLAQFIALLLELRTADPSLTQGRIWSRTDLSPVRIRYALTGAIVKSLAYTDDSMTPLAHNFLDSTVHNNTATATPTRGDIITAQTVTPAWTRLALGAAAKYVRSDGTDALWNVLDANDLVNRIPQVNQRLGTTVLISTDETDVTGTVTNATAKTFSLSANTYARVIAEAELLVTGVANQAFNIDFTLKIDGTNIDDTCSLKEPAEGAGNQDILAGTLKGSKVQTAAVTVTISVTVNAGGATWRVRSLRVYGVV